jgi:hypothetical protein
MVQRSSAELYEHVPVAGHRLGCVLVSENLGAPVLMYADRLHGVTIVA